MRKNGLPTSTPVVSKAAASNSLGFGNAGGLAVVNFVFCVLHTVHFDRIARKYFQPLRIQNFSCNRLQSPYT
jgi:hypothetical protein